MTNANVNNHSITQAVVYCRVSHTNQTTKGNGLGSQETRCREYARYKGYEVVRVFQDDASGSLIDRPGMQSMLSFLRRKKESCVVIIDDVSRLARGLEAHLHLRSDINAVGARLESPSIEFGEDSDSVLVENLLASVSQHQRQKNAEQTKNRMRARLSNGYWVFQAPRGYEYQHVRGEGRILMPVEPVASYIREALESFASGRFDKQMEIKHFLESKTDYFRPSESGEVLYQRIREMLQQPLYAGFVEYQKWGISRRKARHEGLISYETFQRIQKRLNNTGSISTARPVNINEAFPLRGMITCGDCGNPLTSCWSRSKSGKKHPYYLCYQKGCTSYRKSIRREDVEGSFEDFLKSVQPSMDMANLARSVFEELWDQRHTNAEQDRQRRQQRLKDVDKEISGLVDRMLKTSTEAIIQGCERRITELENEKLELLETVHDGPKITKTFQELFEPALHFLSNPWSLWRSGNFDIKKMVLKLVLNGPLSYKKGEGLRTPILSLPFSMLGDISNVERGMARPAGFEPATCRLEGGCSIQLS